MAGLDKLSEEFIRAEASLRKALAREMLVRKRGGSGGRATDGTASRSLGRRPARERRRRCLGG